MTLHVVSNTMQFRSSFSWTLKYFRAFLLACFFPVLSSDFHPLYADILLNGGLESFSAGLPTGWFYARGGNTNAPAVESATLTSPFTNNYGTSTRSVVLPSVGNSQFHSLGQSFSSQRGQATFSFDFQFTTSNSEWAFVNLRNGVSSSGGIIELRFMDGDLIVNDRNFTKSRATYASGIWYQLKLDLDLDSARYRGTLSRTTGTPVVWNDELYTASTQGLASAFFDVNGSQQAKSGAFVLDNVIVAVPEPTSAHLIFAATCCLFFLGLGKARCTGGSISSK